MGVGRFICVALPFILSAFSLIFLLVACLAGVSNKDLYMFKVDARDAQISAQDIASLVEDYVGDSITLPEGISIPDDFDISQLPDNIKLPEGVDLPEGVSLPGSRRRDVDYVVVDDRAIEKREGNLNITAKNLGLDYEFFVSLWNYCSERDGEGKDCIEPEFDWANENLNTTFIQHIETLSQGAIKLPDEISDALDVFKDAIKWTQVVYIIAFLTIALSVFFGIFATCTRVMSCVTYIFAQIASVAVCAAAGLSTGLALAVVGAVESSAKVYGVRADFNTSFLTLVWLSFACALGASFFWLFTICCCAPNHKSSRGSRSRSGSSSNEKLVGGTSGPYQPLGGSPQQSHQGFYNPQQNTAYGGRGMAYEPYSHRV